MNEFMIALGALGTLMILFVLVVIFYGVTIKLIIEKFEKDKDEKDED